MKKYILFFLLCFLLKTLFAQTEYYYVTGTIIDAVTKQPLQSASVFAQNTTQGTATNANGEFKLALANGGYQLVFTYTGYQTETKRVTTADAENKNIVIELKQKEKELQDVVIKASSEVKDGWEKYGSFFLDNFIGTTNNSKNCFIKNKDALHFYFSKKRNRLKVLATEPLQIENQSLGYNIKYTVDSFIYDYNTQVNTFTGYPLFTQLNTTNVAQQNIWTKNRLEAYNGSLLHFMRSIYNKQLKENGFEIQFVLKTDSAETALPLLNFYGALNYNKDDSTQTVEILPNQMQMVVIYKNAKPDAIYIDNNPTEPNNYQVSILTFTTNQSIIIEQNGYYFNQSDITITQYLSSKKMADMLPYDFRVE